jgi:NADH dehydrogenase
MPAAPKRILILGGGFGGVYTAMALEKLMGRDPDVELTLVNRNNYFVFQPLLPEVLSGTLGILDPIIPLRRLCPRVKLYAREIEEIDVDARRVVVSPGPARKTAVLHYDHLVLALGNVTRLSGIPGLQEHALPFKYLGDALAPRNLLLHALEEAAVEDDADVRRRLLTLVVVGGGYSGVEVAAELSDFIRKVAKNYPTLRRDELRVVLLELGPRILPELPDDLANFAHELLVRRGVEIRIKTGLVGATADSALLDSGEQLPTTTLVSTVPSAPNPLVTSLPCRLERGRIVVDEFLEVPGHPGIWAVGDCAWAIDPATGRPHPPTAQHAIREGRCAAHNIAATLRGGVRKPFVFSTLGVMANFGRHSAVASIRGVKLSGFPAWLLHRCAYLSKIPGADRKVRVLMGWLLDLLLPPDIVQLKTDKPATIGRQHFEGGQVILRQGDAPDLVYSIVKGEVEVLRESPPDKLEVLGRLGPGQWFGEMALVSHLPRNATVRCLTPVDVLTLDREGFNALFSSVPALRELFEDLIRKRGSIG